MGVNTRLMVTLNSASRCLTVQVCSSLETNAMVENSQFVLLEAVFLFPVPLSELGLPRRSQGRYSFGFLVDAFEAQEIVNA